MRRAAVSARFLERSGPQSDRIEEGLAVKVLHGLHAEDRTRRERFFRGALKMAELHHPGIVRVIEAELEENGKHFFVMDYVGGGDLRRAVLAGELAQEKVLPVLLAVGEALAYAHGKRIIHRDVKPANILLDGDRPKLTDFDLCLRGSRGRSPIPRCSPVRGHSSLF